MIGNYLYEMRNLSQIKRFQNKKKTTHISVVDHRLFTAKTTQLLFYWIDEYNLVNNDKFIINKEVALMKSILSSTHKLYQGEIQFNVLKYKNIKKSLESVSDVIYDTKYSAILPNFLPKDFKEFVLTNDLSNNENLLVKMSSLITTTIECLEEIENNNLIFIPVFYEAVEQLVKLSCERDFYLLNIFLNYGLTSILNNMSLNANIINLELLVKKVKLDRQKDIEMSSFIESFRNTFCLYIIQMRDTREITRFQNKFKLKKRTVAEHEYFVALSSLIFGLYERQFNKDIDMSKLMTIALFHDDIECLTGDILSGTKRANTKLEKAISKVEEDFYDSYYMPMFPIKCNDIYRSYILNPKEDSIEGTLISAIDTIDVLFEAIEELNLGNSIFTNVYENSMYKLKSYNLVGVSCFLNDSVKPLLQLGIEQIAACLL